MDDIRRNKTRNPQKDRSNEEETKMTDKIKKLSKTTNRDKKEHHGRNPKNTTRRTRQNK